MKIIPFGEQLIIILASFIKCHYTRGVLVCIWSDKYEVPVFFSLQSQLKQTSNPPWVLNIRLRKSKDPWNSLRIRICDTLGPKPVTKIPNNNVKVRKKLEYYTAGSAKLSSCSVVALFKSCKTVPLQLVYTTKQRRLESPPPPPVAAPGWAASLSAPLWTGYVRGGVLTGPAAAWHLSDCAPLPRYSQAACDGWRMWYRYWSFPHFRSWQI